jgi:hypothetical protein
MKRKKFSSLVLGLCVALAMPLIGCGDDGNGGSHQFTGILGSFASSRGDDGLPAEPVSGITVKALDNETGDELGKETKSDAKGYVVFDGLPAGKVGFMAVGVTGDLVDTYQFEIDSDSQDEVLWVVDFNTYTAAPALAAVTIDPSKGIAAGAIYWKDTAECEYPIGCATVKTDPESGEVRYFGDNDMPTKTKADDAENGRDDVNPLNGYYLVANIDPGPVAVNAYMGTDLLGSTNFVVFADSICIGNIYPEAASNPQPDTCLPESVATWCP